MKYVLSSTNTATKNARAKGTTEYVPTNSKLLHIVLDIRVYRRHYIGSDHTLVISKLAVPTRWHKFRAK
jgi:hypothetical protein